MSKKIWRKNNEKLTVLDTPKERELSDKDFTKIIQADVNSQLMWITARSCKGIPCKECYIKDKCQSKQVDLSQSLAASIIKGAISK